MIKKINFCILLCSCALSCYGLADLKEFPKYFSTSTWEAIRFANDQNYIKAKKITAIMDSPVSYEEDLVNDEEVQKA